MKTLWFVNGVQCMNKSAAHRAFEDSGGTATVLYVQETDKTSEFQAERVARHDKFVREWVGGEEEARAILAKRK
jgi:hypothetical protein